MFISTISFFTKDVCYEHLRNIFLTELESFLLEKTNKYVVRIVSASFGLSITKIENSETMVVMFNATRIERFLLITKKEKPSDDIIRVEMASPKEFVIFKNANLLTVTF